MMTAMHCDPRMRLLGVIILCLLGNQRSLRASGSDTEVFGETCPQFLNGPIVLEKWSEDRSVGSPWVIYSNSLYEMWYSSSFIDGNSTIFYATSPDGTNWTEHGIALSPGQGWDNIHVFNCAVIKESGEYKMWYTGYPTSGGHGIGFATSTDGLNWTKYEGSPVFEAGTGWDEWAPFIGSVLWNSNLERYEMWYSAGSGWYHNLKVGMAVSPDGITWTRMPGPVFTAGETVEWIFNHAQVIRNGPFYEMYYSTSTNDIRFARSSDGLTWDTFNCPAALLPSSSGWDNYRVRHSAVLIDDSGRRTMWYLGSASGDDASAAIGRAQLESPPCDVGFEVRERILLGSHYTQRNGGIGLSPDETRLYVAYWGDTESDKIEEYSFPDLDPLCEIGYGRCHGDVAVSSNGARIFAPTYYQGTISYWDLNENCLWPRADFSAGSWPSTIALTPDRHRLLVGAGRDGQEYNQYNDRIQVIDVAGDAFASICTVPIDDECSTNQVPFTADGTYAYFTTVRKWEADAPDRIYEFSMTDCTVLRTADISGSHRSSTSIALAKGRLFVNDITNIGIRVFDRATLTQIDFWGLPAEPGALAVHPDGRTLYVLMPTARMIAVVDSVTGEWLGDSGDLLLDLRDIEFSQNGLLVAVSGGGDDNGIAVLEITDLCPEILLRTGSELDAACVTTGDAVSVELQVATVADGINGVQGLISYDPAMLALNAAATTEAAGWRRVFLMDSGGQVTYAAMMEGGSVGPGVGPFPVATLVFDAIAEGSTNVGFRPDAPPFTTMITRVADGGAIRGEELTRTDSGVISIDDTLPGADNTGPVCAGTTVELFGGPDGMAAYAWTGPDGFTSDEQNPTVSPVVAGEYCLTVTNADGCELGPACTQVDVYSCLTVNISIPGLVGGPVDREATFELTACDGATQTRALVVHFAPAGNAGVGTAVLEDVDPETDWVAVYEGHTLRTLAAVELGGGSTSVDVGLRSGDLQVATIAQDGVVDILDFAILAERWGTNVADCGAGDPEDCSLGADVTGDGLQNDADFVLMESHFFEVGDEVDGCPQSSIGGGGAGAGGKPPMSSMQLGSLTQVLKSARTVDLTRDGVIDIRDMRAFAKKHGLQLSARTEALAWELDKAAENATPER